MSEPTWCGLRNRRVPLSQLRTAADFGRSGRLKPYWGKPDVQNFRGGRGNPAWWRTEAPPTERGGKRSDSPPRPTAPLLYSRGLRPRRTTRPSSRKGPVDVRSSAGGHGEDSEPRNRVTLADWCRMSEQTRGQTDEWAGAWTWNRATRRAPGGVDV